MKNISVTKSIAIGIFLFIFTCFSTSVFGFCTLTMSTTINNHVTCFGACDGSATISATTGSMPYTYLWDDPNSQTTATANGLCAGTYYPSVTDATGLTCFDSIIINQPNDISITMNTNDESCNGTCDGSLNASVSGGTQPLSYSWSNGGTSSSSSLTGLCAGIYNVTVTDANGCTKTGTYVTIIATPSVSASITDESCSGACNGSINLTVQGQAPTYNWSWGNGSSSATTKNLANLCSDTYLVTITDGPCITNTSFTVSANPNISLSISATDATCNNSNGTATATASGGSGTFSYNWNNSATTSSISNLTAGTYTVTVTDGIGCSTTGSVNVYSSGGPSVSINFADITCYGDSDGSISAIVFNGTSPYTFLWSNTATSTAINGLDTGTYILVVTDANGCTNTNSITINEPLPISANFSVTEPTCYGSCDGKIAVNANGGTPPYLFNGQSSNILTGYCAGNYPVIIKDSKECKLINVGTINDPPIIQVNTSVSDASCGEPDGSATVTSTGGIPPYSYQWTSGDILATADSLLAGMYMVSVTDNSGCSNFALVVINDSNAPSITVSSTSDVTCPGSGDGSIDISVSGGATPYTYFWSNGATIEDINNLVAGPYEITIYDANGCTASKSIPVFGPQPLSIAKVSNSPNCGQANGSLSVLISGGTQPYSINWSNGDTTDTINGLTWGVYHVTVTDNNGCIKYGAAALSEQGGTSVQIDSITDVICGGTGGVSVTVTNGVAPFTYTWFKDSAIIATTEDLQGVQAGTYDLIITDSNGCMGAASATISGIGTNPEPICIVTVDPVSGMNVCVWEKNDTSNIASYNCYKESTTSGVYFLIKSVPFSTTDSSFYIDWVSNPMTRAWRYRVSTVDNCGNESALSEVHKTMHLTINVGLNNTYNLIWDHYEGISFGTYTIDRYHPSTGWDSLTSIPSNLTSYTDDASSLPDQNNIHYRIVIEHPTGCSPSKIKNYNSSKSNTSAISVGAILSATTTTTGASQNICNGTATVYAAGGSAPYLYLWNDPLAQTTETATGLCADTFLVIVIDAFGDSINATAIVTELSALTLTASSSYADIGVCNGTATVVVTGGIPPYSYLWDGSTGFQSTPTAQLLCPGTYTVLVTDSLGNTETISVTVSELTGIIESQGFENILIYPNPNSGQMVIEGYGNNLISIEIYNLVGKLVKTAGIDANKTLIDLRKNGAGIYTLKLTTINSVHIKKIIIE